MNNRSRRLYEDGGSFPCTIAIVAASLWLAMLAVVSGSFGNVKSSSASRSLAQVFGLRFKSLDSSRLKEAAALGIPVIAQVINIPVLMRLERNLLPVAVQKLLSIFQLSSAFFSCGL